MNGDGTSTARVNITLRKTLVKRNFAVDKTLPFGVSAVTVFFAMGEIGVASLKGFP
jgi:hypothetical protein